MNYTHNPYYACLQPAPAPQVHWLVQPQVQRSFVSEGCAPLPYAGLATLPSTTAYCTEPPLPRAVQPMSSEEAVIGHLPGRGFKPIHVNALMRTLPMPPVSAASLLPRGDLARVQLQPGSFEQVKRQMECVVATPHEFILCANPGIAHELSQTPGNRVLTLERPHQRPYDMEQRLF